MPGHRRSAFILALFLTMSALIGAPANADGWPGAQWITAGSESPLLRHEFTLDKPVASAHVDVYGLGFYELHLNGGKVGDHVLAPAATIFEQRNLYDNYDVTSQVHQGVNAVGLWLGNGYGAGFSPYGFRWTGPKQAILRLNVTFTDGSQRTVGTGNTWRWSPSPITANDIYNGETYDARLTQNGWDNPGFKDAHWQSVRTATAPSQILTATKTPPVRVTETLHATKLTQPQPGVYVYDFGQNIAGWARLTVTGTAGTTVKMRTAEELHADGTLDTTTNRNAAATDTYILAEGTQTYEPRFTYHGFRYLELTGYPGTPDSVVAVVAHADVVSTGTFESSDPLLNQIWRNNRWAILNNSMSLPTDTPVRDERTPPSMDVQAYQDAAVREFRMDRFYAKYLEDTPPTLASDSADSLQPDMGGGPVALAWTLYEQYADKDVLARTYPAMKDYVDTAARVNPGLVWRDDRGFGDWCPPDRSPKSNGGQGAPNAGDCFSERAAVNTALFYLQATDTAKAATALDKPDDAAHFNHLAAAVAQAYTNRFLAQPRANPDVTGRSRAQAQVDPGDAANRSLGAGRGGGATGVTGTAGVANQPLPADGGKRFRAAEARGRQVVSVLPLAFGMVPADKVQAVGAGLVDTILTRDQGHLDTGIFGTRYLLDALARIGRMDVARTVLGQTTYPGFGYEIQRGATTPWEQWTYESGMETHDHAMFAGLNASLYTQLAGITPASPGYATVDIAPKVPGGLEHVAGAIDTVRGRVASAWTNRGCQFDLSVTVPTTATVTLPVRGSVRVPSGATVVSDGRYSVGPGTWQFGVKHC